MSCPDHVTIDGMVFFSFGIQTITSCNLLNTSPSGEKEKNFQWLFNTIFIVSKERILLILSRK